MNFRRLIIIIVVNAILIVALGAIAEFAARKLRPHYQRSYRTYVGQLKNMEFSYYQASWHRPAPSLGWVCNDNEKIKFANEKYNRQKIFYRRNPQGFRCEADFDALDATPKKKRVMLLGDSFIFGVYLQENETLQAALAEKLGSSYQFCNMGIPGWGIDQMYMAYKKYRDLIQPDVVILLYIDDNINRTFQAFRLAEGMNKPCFTVKDNQLVPRQDDGHSLFEILCFKSILFNVLYKKYELYESTRVVKAIFSEFRQSTSKRQTKFVVLRLPYEEHVLSGNMAEKRSFSKFFKNTPGQYFELINSMKSLPSKKKVTLYLEDDGHLSATGTQLIADFIANTILSSSAL